MHLQKLSAVVLLFASSLLAQPRDAVLDQTMTTLMRVQTFDETAISPDGSCVAYVKTVHTPNGQRAPESGVYVQSLGAAQSPAVRVTTRTSDEPSGIAWSPDGMQIAFVADQLYLAPRDGGRARAITAVKGALSMPKWSPDGKSVAVLFIENASLKGGALEAMTPPSGDVEMQVEEQRIAIVDLATKKVDLVTPANMYVYDYDWSPDSRSFAAEAAFGSGEDNYWVAEVWRFDRGESKGRSIYKPSLQIANPRWSPDGKSVAFIEGLMSDQGVTGGDIFVVPAEGGPATNVTPSMHASATWLQWSSPDRILFGENINGLSGFATVSVPAAAIAQLWSGEGKLTTSFVISVSASRDGETTAAVRESFTRPPEVVAGPIGAWKPVTHANDAVKPLWGRSQNVNWTSDGFQVQGWLLYPRQTEGAKLPLVVQVHGGPSSGALSQWPSLNLASLVANGYAVLMPNPRGSFGQGEAFTRANVKDFGYGDLRDILRGVDAAVAAAPVDKDRVGIWGWSYGGYMTMWAVTQTQRFKAAVAGAGLSNWQSYYGQNSIDQWMIPFFGASVYDDPYIYRRSSPIEFIRNVKTPTLVVVGDRDGEVPSPQSFEFWHALRTLGVRTKLVVYPNEGHRFVDPEHKRDLARRVVLWFDENL